jgi:hypothetical protein
MTRWRTVATLGICAAVLGLTAWAQPLDEAARQDVQDELNAFFDQYYEWYSAGSADEISRHAYNVPYQLGNGTALATRAEVRQWVEDAYTRLDAQGYGRSAMPDRNICVLSSGAAMVSGRGVRYRTDGSELGEYGWTYTVVRTDEGWRIVSIFGHDPGVAVRC